MRLRSASPLGLLGLACCACGAFADAGQDGTPYDSTLSFFVGDEPNQTIRQGEKEQYRIVFDTPVPWSGAGADSGVYFNVTRFDFLRDGERRDDIRANPSYDGGDEVVALLDAWIHAEVGERELWLNLAYQEFGKPQRIFRGFGLFFVGASPQQSTEDGAGADGEDGGDGTRPDGADGGGS